MNPIIDYFIFAIGIILGTVIGMWIERSPIEDDQYDLDQVEADLEEEERHRTELARLREQATHLPCLHPGFVEEVAGMSRQELQRRLLNGSDWTGAFHKCLDGIPEIMVMPGASIDGCRDPREIRRIVETLVKHCPITWQNKWQGEPKNVSVSAT